MKKLWLNAFLFLTVVTTGCGMNGTPGDLLRAPAQDAGEQSLTQAVMQFLPAGAHLTVPLRSEAGSAIQQRDLDADGRAEIVAFYKTDKTDYEIGVLILKETDNHWSKIAALTGVGKELDYVQFGDVTGDSVPEMLLGFSGGEGLARELSVYSLRNRQAVELAKMIYSDLAVGDLNGDSTPEIALMNTDESQGRTQVEVYGAKNGKLEMLADREMEGIAYHLLIGKASSSRNGLFIDASIGAHSAYTSLLVWENGKLSNVLQKGKDELALTSKEYPLDSKDVNGDGIIEIGLLAVPPGIDAGEFAPSALPYITKYCQWDGKSGLNEAAEFFSRWGYSVRVPDKWVGKYTIKPPQNVDYTEVQFETVKDKAPLLTLRLVFDSDWSKAEANLNAGNIPYTVLDKEKPDPEEETTNGTRFVAVQPTGKVKLSGSALREYKKLLLTQDEVRMLANHPTLDDSESSNASYQLP